MAAARIKHFLTLAALCAGIGVGFLLSQRPSKFIPPSPKPNTATTDKSERLRQHDDAMNAFLHSRELGAEISNQQVVKLTGRLREWLRQDAVRCLNFLSDQGAIGLIGEDEILDILERTQGAMPLTLIRLAQDFHDKTIAEALMKRAFLAEVNRSPLTSLELLEVLPRHLQPIAEEEAVRRIAASQGVAGLKSILDRYNLSFRAVRQGIAVIGRHKPSEAFDLLKGSRAQIDEAMSGAFLDAAVGSTGYYQALAHFINVAKPDADAALSGLQQLPASPAVDSMIRGVIAAKLVKDPTAADRLTEGVSAADSSKILASVAAVIEKDQPEMAARLIEKIPVDRAQAEAYAKRGDWMIKFGRAAAALDMVSLAANPVVRAQSIRVLAQKWIEADPAPAFAYAAARAEDPAFASALSTALGKSLDPDDAPASIKRLASLRGLSPEAKAAIRDLAGNQLEPGKRSLLGAILQ